MSDESSNSRDAAPKTPVFEALRPLIDAGYECIPLHHPAALDHRGRKIGKAPRKGWRTDPAMTADEARDHMAGGSNVGIRLGPNDLVVDVDPRHFEEGDDPVARLQADLGISLDYWPTVRTGSGGSHHYMCMAEPVLLRDSLEGYPGIEFKALGRQMVAPGSVHPDTGRLYEVDPLADDFGSVPDAPAALVELARRPERPSAAEAGEVTPELLAEMLDALKVEDYRDQTKWLELMMACHHATAGEGRDEFIEWSTGDPQYQNDAWIIGQRWDSLHSDAAGRRITQKTLFKALHEVGRGDLVDEKDRSDPADEFPVHDPLDEPHMPHAVAPTKAKRQANALKARKAKAEKGKLRKLQAAETREEYARWLNRTFVYDRSSGRRVNIETGEAMDDAVFESEHGPGWARSGGKGTLVNAIKTGKAGLDLRSVMMAASFPGRERFVEVDMGTHQDFALNTWYDTTLEPVEGHHGWFRAEVERLFPGDEGQQSILLDYWAARCMEPGRKVRWQLVIESVQGVGKGSMRSGFETLFGWRNSGTFGLTQMRDKFNAWMVSAANLFGEEIGFGTWKEAKEAYENMKAPITDDFIAVRPMQKESQVRVPNGTNYIVNRNPSGKFYCPEDDRRICYLRPSPEDLDEKGVHFQALSRHYASRDDMAAVRWWLMKEWAKDRAVIERGGERLAGVGLVRYDDDPPMTDAKRKLMRECLRADDRDALDYGELERLLRGVEVLTADDALRLVRESALDRFDATDDQLLDAIRKWLKAAGFQKHRRNTSGQALQLYSPPGEKKWSAMGAAERERAYLDRE